MWGKEGIEGLREWSLTESTRRIEVLREKRESASEK